MRLTTLALLIAFASPAFAASVQTRAPYALLIDHDTGKILFAKNANANMAPASTTKILTAEVIFSLLASGKLSVDDKFAISAHAATEGDAKSGGSSMFVVAGSRIKIDDLLSGMLTDSGNDAAIALAEGVAGSEAKFAGIMNAHARAIGMAHSRFSNPWGRAGNRVTASDMARLASYVIATYPQYYKYFGLPEFTWNGIRQANRNPLIAEGADGLKTGHLTSTGFGLVASARVGGHRLILVINGLKSEADRASEGRRLLEFGKAAIGG